MEYINGGSIADKMVKDKAPITEVNAIAYIDQILSALCFIHWKGIIHSDLKCKKKRVLLAVLNVNKVIDYKK